MPPTVNLFQLAAALLGGLVLAFVAAIILLALSDDSHRY